MRRNLFLSAIFLLFGLSALSALAQTTPKPSAISGEVGSVDGGKIFLKTATGEIEAVLSDKTQYFRVPPENPKLAAAVASTLAEISVGDKLLVTGILADDKKSIPAKAVYLMSKSAIAQRQISYLEDWKKRGTNGRVVNFNPQTSVITITTRSFGVEKTISVKTAGKTEFYRYAPDSTEFAKALKSSLADIEPNDEIRVLGNKNADGTEIEAEKVVTGAYVQKGGKIKAIDLEKKEIVITDTSTNKDVAVVLNDYSILKQFPAELAQRMAGMQAGLGAGQGGFRPPTQGGGQTTPQPAGQQNPQTTGGTGQGGFRPGGGGGGIDDSRFQNIKISDLKVGDAIGILISKKSDPARVTAVKLFTGVEPFITRAQAAGGGGGGRQNGGGGASLNIPGLDGFGGN